MNPHSQLRDNFRSAIRKSCNKQGCRLRLDSLSSYTITIVDADDYRQVCGYTGKICDYFLFLTARGLTVAVVEMKAGGVKASDAVKQIRNGAKESEKLMGSRSASQFYAILLSRHVHTSESKVLTKRKVKFQGREYPIIRDKCGAKLREIMNKYKQ